MTKLGKKQQIRSTFNPEKELNLAELIKGAAHYFPHGKGVDRAEYIRLTEKFYLSLNVKHRGRSWDFMDCTALGIALEEGAVHAGEARKPAAEQSLLVIGCGDGRLVETYICWAKKRRFSKIVFNDMFNFNLAATKAAVKACHKETKGLKIEYLQGDIADRNLQGEFSLVVAMYFVSSDVLDLQSSDELSEVRARYFLAVRNALHLGGVFIEDLPDMTRDGFYRELYRKSATALAPVISLDDHRRSFVISALDKPEGEFPYHIRYAPHISRQLIERMALGFSLKSSWDYSIEMPNDSLEHSKHLCLWQKR